MDTDIDEREPRHNGRPATIPPLPLDASQEDMIQHLNLLTDAVNAHATAARTHSVELEGVRLALQAHGTNIETTLRNAVQSIERTLGVAKTRPTDPAPPPEPGD